MEAAILDSRRNRSRNESSPASSGAISFSATGRSSAELRRPIHDTHPTPADHTLDSIAGELGSYLGHLGVRFSTLGSTM